MVFTISPISLKGPSAEELKQNEALAKVPARSRRVSGRAMFVVEAHAHKILSLCFLIVQLVSV